MTIAKPACKPLLLVVVVTLLLAGCSRMRIAYNSADFFIERYADDYLSLDSAQMERWTPTLEAALARHRAQELPYLATFFDSAQRDARKGFRHADTVCLMDQFEVIYRRHFTLAADAAAPLLAELDKQQIDALERTFRKEARDDAADNDRQSVEHRLRKRAKRYEENMQWWIGDLTDAQRAIVGQVTRSIPDTAKDWYQYRDGKRRELIKLLRAGASEQRIQAFLTDWLVHYSDLPSSLRRAQPELRRGVSDLLVRLDPTLDVAQRRHFIDRLTKLRDDFMALQKHPHMVPTGC